jgi:hypothetical protein
VEEAGQWRSHCHNYRRALASAVGSSVPRPADPLQPYHLLCCIHHRAHHPRGDVRYRSRVACGCTIAGLPPPPPRKSPVLSPRARKAVRVHFRGLRELWASSISHTEPWCGVNFSSSLFCRRRPLRSVIMLHHLRQVLSVRRGGSPARTDARCGFAWAEPCTRPLEFFAGAGAPPHHRSVPWEDVSASWIAVRLFLPYLPRSVLNVALSAMSFGGRRVRHCFSPASTPLGELCSSRWMFCQWCEAYPLSIRERTSVISSPYWCVGYEVRSLARR